MRYYQIKEAIDTGTLDPNLDAELKDTAKEIDPKSAEDKRSFIDSVKMLGQKIDDLVAKQIADFKKKQPNTKPPVTDPVEEDGAAVALPMPTADVSSIFRTCREYIRNKFNEAKQKYASNNIPEDTQKILLKDVKQNALNDFRSIYSQGYTQGGTDKEEEFAEYKKTLNTKVVQLVKKAEGLKPNTPLDRKTMSAVQSSIEAKLKQIIDQMEESGGKPAVINEFLDLAIEGKVIDMKALVNARKGKIDDHVSKDLSPEIQKLFDEEIKSAFFGFIPGGTTSGNYGPAEVGLAILGNPAKKADDGGDLLVGTTKFELKGSGYKEPSKRDPSVGSGLYGARLNSKGIGPGTSGWDKLDSEIKKIQPKIKEVNLDQDPKNSGETTKGYLRYMRASKIKGKISYKLASRYNFNSKGLKALNEEILVPNGKVEDTERLLSETLKAIINGWKKVDNWDDHIASMVNPDGSIHEERFKHHFSALAYDSYNKEDKVENILFVNSWNRNYYLIKTQAELLKAVADKDIEVTGGITWNDDQQKATPQYARR
jgi:hypothetical protein